MQSIKQNRPKRRRINSAIELDTHQPIIINDDKVIIGKVVYQKVGEVTKGRK